MESKANRDSLLACSLYSKREMSPKTCGQTTHRNGHQNRHQNTNIEIEIVSVIFGIVLLKSFMDFIGRAECYFEGNVNKLSFTEVIFFKDSLFLIYEQPWLKRTIHANGVQYCSMKFVELRCISIYFHDHFYKSITHFVAIDTRAKSPITFTTTVNVENKTTWMIAETNTIRRSQFFKMKKKPGKIKEKE